MLNATGWLFMCWLHCKGFAPQWMETDEVDGCLVLLWESDPHQLAVVLGPLGAEFAWYRRGHNHQRALPDGRSRALLFSASRRVMAC